MGKRNITCIYNMSLKKKDQRACKLIRKHNLFYTIRLIRVKVIQMYKGNLERKYVSVCLYL